MTPLSWKAFRERHDPLAASHRGLNSQLIPQWLKQPKSLQDKIESSAYGETPREVFDRFLKHLDLRPGETVLDLGSGAGSACAALAELGFQAVGIERNPELHRLALKFRQSQAEHWWQLELADFLEVSWPKVEAIYTTTARFPPTVLHALAHKVDRADSVKAVLSLGRPLPLLSSRWQTFLLGAHQLRWNPSEQTLTEQVHLHRRSCLTDPPGCI